MPDTGAPWFIPYVESTDLVSAWPTDSLALANAIVAALEDIPVTQKKIEAFTGSGTWTVPAGVTYAIAHMMGGGGGVGTGTTGGAGGNSTVAFVSGTVTGPGAQGVSGTTGANTNARVGVNNLGQSAQNVDTSGSGRAHFGGAPTNQFIVAAAAVTPAASITVTVGAGGSAGTSGAAGGSGYVYIEYYEEV